MEISKMWTLSTAHITRETDKWLTEQSMEPTVGLVVYEKTGGHFIYVPSYFEWNEMDTPEDIDPIFATAIAENLDWICLDSDGPIDNGFKIYEWED